MRTLLGVVLTLGIAASAVQNADADIKHRFGAGVHYWTTVEDIDLDNVKEDGFAYLVSYQLRPASLIKFGLDVEMLPFIYLDINANYRFENWDDIKALDEKVSSDTITIGAAVRLEL